MTDHDYPGIIARAERAEAALIAFGRVDLEADVEGVDRDASDEGQDFVVRHYDAWTTLRRVAREAALAAEKEGPSHDEKDRTSNEQP